jgi:aminomethyltransferase
MKETIFTATHRMLGAKMAEFAGFQMPIEYTGIVHEHMAVIENGGIFDVSHMGEFVFSGESGYKLLQYLTCNDISAMKNCDCQYSCLMNEDGGVVDDIIIYCFEEKNNYMVVVNASNIDKDFAHVAKYSDRFGAKIDDDIKNISDNISLIAVQGPKARWLTNCFMSGEIMDTKTYKFKFVHINGIGKALYAATGYTGLGGGELYMDKRDIKDNNMFEMLVNRGRNYGIVPAGLGARDTLRLEMGYCLYGHELSESTSPLEANLNWIVKFNHDFLGMEALLKQKENGLKRKLIGFKMLERAVPRSNYILYNSIGEQIGMVTSGNMSPYCNIGIGLGYVNIENTAAGTKIYVKIREKLVEAEVVKPPFRKLEPINMTEEPLKVELK